MNPLPAWVGWVALLLPIPLGVLVGRLAPQMIPIMLICLPIAYLVGADLSPRNPFWNWRKDRA